MEDYVIINEDKLKGEIIKIYFIPFYKSVSQYINKNIFSKNLDSEIKILHEGRIKDEGNKELVDSYLYNVDCKIPFKIDYFVIVKEFKNNFLIKTQINNVMKKQNLTEEQKIIIIRNVRNYGKSVRELEKAGFSTNEVRVGKLRASLKKNDEVFFNKTLAELGITDSRMKCTWTEDNDFVLLLNAPEGPGVLSKYSKYKNVASILERDDRSCRARHKKILEDENLKERLLDTLARIKEYNKLKEIAKNSNVEVISSPSAESASAFVPPVFASSPMQATLAFASFLIGGVPVVIRDSAKKVCFHQGYVEII